MNKREEIQQEALEKALLYKRCGLSISMGVGKTLIGLRYLEHFYNADKKEFKALVVAPKLSIFKSWEDDAVKFDIPTKVIQKTDFTTYLS